MTIAAPVAGYSFDAQDGTDDVGSLDLDSVWGEYTASAKHGAYALTALYEEGEEETYLLAQRVDFAATFPCQDNVSIACWFYLAGTAYFDLFGRTFTFTATGLEVADGYSEAVLSISQSISEGWHLFVCGVSDDGKLFGSIDGSAITKSALSVGTSPDEQIQVVGYAEGDTADTVVIWDTQVADGDITWLYNSGNGRSIADIVAASSGITIAPNLIASAATVYAPAVQPGSITVSPNAIASAATVYQPAVQPGSVMVSANRIESTATVYQPAVQPGSISVAPNLIASAAEVNAPAVTMGALTVQAVRIESATTVYDPALTFGSVTVAPERVESAATVYQPFVNVVQTVEPEQVESAAVVYQPAVQPGSITVAPELVAATATVYQPAVHPGSITVSPNAIASVVAVYQPAVGVVQTIEVERVESAAQVYAPAVQVGALTIYPAAVASGVQVYQPLVLPGAITIEPGRIESTAQVFPVWFIMLSVVTGAARIHTVGQDGRSFTPVDDRVVSVGAEARSVAVTGE